MRDSERWREPLHCEYFFSGKAREVFADLTQPPGACKMVLEQCQDLLRLPAPYTAPALHAQQVCTRGWWCSPFCWLKIKAAPPEEFPQWCLPTREMCPYCTPTRGSASLTHPRARDKGSFPLPLLAVGHLRVGHRGCISLEHHHQHPNARHGNNITVSLLCFSTNF